MYKQWKSKEKALKIAIRICVCVCAHVRVQSTENHKLNMTEQKTPCQCATTYGNKRTKKGNACFFIDLKSTI